MRRYGHLKNSSIYVFFNEDVSIPEELIFYQTALDHYSLKLSTAMELEGMHQNTLSNA